MFSLIRNRFGVPGVISVVALVFAMAGGAYAAKKYVITSTGQIKPAVLRSLQGKAGPAGLDGTDGSAGMDGTNGSPGAAGDDGPKGTPGIPGSPGSPGAPGTDGTSATTTSFTGSKGTCTEGQGGVEVESAGPAAFVCNGKDGQAGFIPTLPPGKTETGAWNLPSGLPAESAAEVSVSFNVPLEVELEAEDFEFVPKNFASTGNCPGTASAPEAAAGKLCLYGATQIGEFFEVTALNAGKSFDSGIGTTGSIIRFATEENPVALAYGTWAVTAPEE